MRRHFLAILFLVTGSIILAIGVNQDETLWQSVLTNLGLSLAVVGFASLTVDRAIIGTVARVGHFVVERVAMPIDSIWATLGLGSGFRSMYASRQDPRFHDSCCELIRSAEDQSKKHCICILGVAGSLFLKPQGRATAVEEALLKLLQQDRRAESPLYVNVCLVYPFSHAARHRAVAEAPWDRPFVETNKEVSSLLPAPPEYQTDVHLYQDSGLYRDCRAVLCRLAGLSTAVGRGVHLSVRYTTLEPHCMILRVDTEIVVESFQLGRMSADNYYVSGHVPIMHFQDVAASGLANPPFRIYHNHFKYLWNCKSTLFIEDVLVPKTDDALPTFALPEKLPMGTPNAESSIRARQARSNCFLVPARRLFERVGGHRLKRAGVTAFGPGGDELQVLDLSIAGMGVAKDGTTWSDGCEVRFNLGESSYSPRVKVHSQGRTDSVGLEFADSLDPSAKRFLQALVCRESPRHAALS